MEHRTLQLRSPNTSRSSACRGGYRSLWVLLNVILSRSHERISAEIVGHKREDQLLLQCLVVVHAFILLSVMLSFAVASVSIVVLLGENLF